MQVKTETSLLLDYYGELLNPYQRRIMRLYADEDLSFSEVASELGVTRQAVADIIARVGKRLAEIESKLGLVSKIRGIERSLDEIIVEATDPVTKQRLLGLKELMRNV